MISKVALFPIALAISVPAHAQAIDSGLEAEVGEAARLARALGFADPGMASDAGRISAAREWRDATVRAIGVAPAIVSPDAAASAAPAMVVPTGQVSAIPAASGFAQGNGPTLPARPRSPTAGGSGIAGGGAKPRASGGGTIRINASASDITTMASSGSATTEIGVTDGSPANISVNARDVTTTASRGTATTEIGAGSGGSSTVSARGIVTRANGTSTTTTIGGSGNVSATDIYNEGGTLAIGSGGYRRDGATCVEIYRQTCIVHFYFRRKNDPCAPGYWIDARKCRLPSDRKHRIGN